MRPALPEHRNAVARIRLEVAQCEVEILQVDERLRSTRSPGVIVVIRYQPLYATPKYT